MPRFAANVSMLFTEVPLIERYARAAAAGFAGVEMLFPYAEDVPAIAAELRANGLTQVLYNFPAGDFAAGERGMANNPARREAFREGVLRALDVASHLQPTRMNCLVGKRLADVPPETQWATVEENLAWAADQVQAAGIRLVVEPLNAWDAPGFLLSTPSAGFALVDRIGHPKLALQYDLYPAQRMEGNLVRTISERIGQIGHIQIADSPDRHQPGTGEINYPFVFDAIDAAGYDGWVSCEYNPLGTTEQSLDWMRARA
ncbi:MAG: hydroxypyruvate isomerase family protein [Chloroflexota bacterium]